MVIVGRGGGRRRRGACESVVGEVAVAVGGGGPIDEPVHRLVSPLGRPAVYRSRPGPVSARTVGSRRAGRPWGLGSVEPDDDLLGAVDRHGGGVCSASRYSNRSMVATFVAPRRLALARGLTCPPARRPQTATIVAMESTRLQDDWQKARDYWPRIHLRQQRIVHQHRRARSH